MKVSVSFLSSDNIPRDLKLLNDTDCDFIHVDIMDGIFVKNKTMPWSEMKNIYKFTDKRLDVHLMVSDPTKYINNYSSLNTEYITIHSEIPGDVNSYIKLIKSYEDAQEYYSDEKNYKKIEDDMNKYLSERQKNKRLIKKNNSFYDFKKKQ